jgi:hypothetical protein
MRATMMYAAGDVGVENVPDATLVEPTDALIRIARACVTVRGGPAPVRAYIEELLPDVLEGRIEPGLVFDRVVSIEEVPAGYQAMNRLESIKVMVQP